MQVPMCVRCGDVPLRLQGRKLLEVYQLGQFAQEAALDARVWVCPKCRRMETVWAFSTLPGGAGLSKVWEYERTFEYCNEKQLRQILEEDKFNEDMKQAARNLLEKKFFGGK